MKKKQTKALPTAEGVWAIVLAAGKASGFTTDVEPSFLSLGSKPVLAYSIQAIERCPEIEGVVVVASKERVDGLRGMLQMFGASKVKAIVSGGPARDEMVKSGLEAVDVSEAGFIAVVDGAIPNLTPELIAETVRAARKHGAASVARQLKGPLAESAKGNKITGLPNGSTWWTTLGPQVFRLDVIRRAMENAAKKRLKVADEAAAVVAMKGEVQLVPTDRMLIRIDSPQDLLLSEFLLTRTQ